MKHYLFGTALLLSACSAPSDGTIIYPAASVLTVDSINAVHTAIAVREGEIVGLGSEASLVEAFKAAEIDRRFETQTIIPGLIDPHIHMTLGAMMYGLDWVPP